jgi:hypothetical protein
VNTTSVQMYIRGANLPEEPEYGPGRPVTLPRQSWWAERFNLRQTWRSKMAMQA